MSVDHGTPTLDEIAVRHGGKPWSVLARNATPEFTVTTGLRRITHQQLDPLRKMGVPITQEVLDKHRWEALWDAPLNLSTPDKQAGAMVRPPVDPIPDTDQPGLPRKPEEIGRAKAEFSVQTCKVTSDGARLTITYPGVTLGLFSGRLEYTVFKGTNLIRQEVIAATDSPWVAYKYDAGLTGIPAIPGSAAMWRDTAGDWQNRAFGDEAPNQELVPVRAANRVVLAQQGAAGAIAAFPPPHKFFWMRSLSEVTGNNWFRGDGDGTFAIGIRQDENAKPPVDDVWALYNARPGTEQLMTMFLYPSTLSSEETAEHVLAFTRGDRFAALPGYKVMQHHIHLGFTNRLRASGNPEMVFPEFEAFKAVGVNIVSEVDGIYYYHGSLPGGTEVQAVLRTGNLHKDHFARIAEAAEGARLNSDSNFLFMADQEVTNSPLGGHTDLLFSHPVYWNLREDGQPFTDMDPTYGKVYHIGSAEDLMKMADAENIIVSVPHPRSKGATPYPDAVKEDWFFRDPRYHGFGLRWGMGLDGSERCTCEYRCLPLLDDMANWMADQAGPLKYAIAISEVRGFHPGDDTYATSPVTYVRLDKVPPPDDRSPLINALRKGEMFVTTGEVLVPRFEIRGTGDKRVAIADVQWTFPLEMVELVWGDGKTTGRKVISTADLPAFGSHRFEIPFDARGKKWVRFAAWDAAYEGAILQPQRLD